MFERIKRWLRRSEPTPLIAPQLGSRWHTQVLSDCRVCLDKGTIIRQSDGERVRCPSCRQPR